MLAYLKPRFCWQGREAWTVLRACDLKLKRGARTAVFGPCGKTTLLKGILGEASVTVSPEIIQSTHNSLLAELLGDVRAKASVPLRCSRLRGASDGL